MTIRRISSNRPPDRVFELITAADLTEARADLATVRDSFAFFLALDLRPLKEEDLRQLAADVADRVVYVCAWGSSCDRVHDLFDAALVESGVADRYTVMTTSHAADSLPDALEFYARAAFPAEDAPPAARWIAAAVGNVDWAPEIEEVLAGE
jgi:hypothetical protein